MGNLMNMVKMSIKPSRNGFDLSFKNNFTAKAGEIRPVMCKPVIPGDVWQCDLKSFTRLQPVNSAAYARMREYYDFYFVPMELLWNKWDTVATQMKDNLQHATGPLIADNVAPSGGIPYITSQQIVGYLKVVKAKTNMFGYSRANMTCILLEYLGYGRFYDYLSDDVTWETSPTCQNLKYSVMPLLAYQHIYADYCRYTQWERTNPSTFNVDYIKGVDDLNVDIEDSDFVKDYNFMDLRYCNYDKDLFFGVLPNAQYGDEAGVDMDVFSSGSLVFKGKDGSLVNGAPTYILGQVTAGGQAVTQLQGLKANFSIIQLRMAEALQRWKEVAQSVSEDYKAQIESQWGVKCSQFLSHQSVYLGGISSSLDINPVVNSNLTGDNVADIQGVGTIYNNGKIRFESGAQYGYIICLYHAVPVFDYQCDGVDAMTTDTDISDFPLPVFDRIGMQQLPSYLLSNPRKSSDSGSDDYFISEFLKQNPYLGYVPRYAPWKTSIDVSRGAFVSTLRNWVIPFDKSLFVQTITNVINNHVENAGSNNSNVNTASFVTWSFFKCNPAVLDTLFAVNADDTVDTDQFLISCFIDIKVVRNLDVNGLPW